MADQAPAFPRDFLWGAATAAHQVEGNATGNDWWAAEQAGRLPHRSAMACRHLELYPQDFDLARAHGHNAHRLSLEWSRLEPRPGVVDEAAVAHYARVLAALRERAIEPIVTLHHVTCPAWFAERGGWLAPDAVALFARYVEQMARRLGAGVRWWITVNEPTVVAKHGYVTGDWPPFRRGRWDLAARVVRAMCAAHRAAYRVLHASRRDLLVSFAHSLPWVEPCDPGRLLDRLAARARALVLNELCLRWAHERGQPLLDYVAINYYTRAVVRWSPHGRGLFFGVDCEEDRHGPRRRFDALGQEVWPKGLLEVLRSCARFGLPLLVTENGIATDDEALRRDHLLGHLGAVAAALAEGLDIRGYLYWSLMDNYEWAHGTTARYGLAATDFATQERRPRPTMRLLAEIARTGRLPTDATTEG